jgi:hypothetical protein
MFHLSTAYSGVAMGPYLVFDYIYCIARGRDCVVEKIIKR